MPTDKERLDWIADANNLFEFVPQMDGGVYVFSYWAKALGGDEDTGIYFRTLRKSIDAAMKAAEPGGEGK